MRLKSWLTSPVFEDEIKTQQAYLLHAILWTLIFVPIVYLIFVFMGGTDNPSRALWQSAFGEITNIILLILLRRGSVRLASILQVSAFWFFFTITAITGNGVRGEAYLLGYSVVIAIAGMLLGAAGATLFTILSLAAGGVMVYGQTKGLFVPKFQGSLLATWTVSLLLFPVGAVLQHLGSRIIRTSLARARASEARYRLISQVSSNYTFSTELDAQGNMRLNWVAGALEKITGYTFDDYVASGGWLAHLHPEDVENDAQALEKLKNNERVVHDIRTFTKDKSLRWVRVYAHPVWDAQQNRLSGIVGAVQDITEQKQAEEALRRSESIYRRAIEVSGAVPYHQTFDAEGRIIYDFMGEGIRQITGYGPEEFDDDLWGSLVQERQLLEDLEPYSLDEAIQQVRTGRIPIWKCEHCIKARDGKIHWVFEAAVDLRDQQGIAYGSVGLYQDITERKQSEDVLKYERDLLQIFLDHTPDTVFFKDTEARFVRINKTEARFLGLDDPKDAIGKTDFDFQSFELAQQFMEEEKHIRETGQSVVNRIEMNPARDGKPRWLSTSKVPVSDAAGHITGIIGISRDVTEQILSEQYEQRRRDVLEKIIKLGQYVTEVQDVRSALQRIWRSVRHDLGFDRLGIYLYDPQLKAMDGSYGTSNDGEMVEEWSTHILLTDPTVETVSFIKSLQEANGLYLTHNYDVEHNVSEGNIMHGVKDYAAVAAWAGDKPVAVLCVDNLTTQRPIADEKLEALRLFAGYAGLAIENARLSDALQNELTQQKRAEERASQRRAILEKVVILGQQVTEVSDLRTTLEKIWHGVHDTLEFDRLGIFLYNAEHNSMDGTLGTNRQGQIVEEWDRWFSLSDAALFTRAIEKPDTIYFTHNYDAENEFEEGHEMYGVKDFAAVAAWAGGKPVAVICVDRVITQSTITEEQLEALRLFSGYAGLAIENARLNDKLQSELIQQKQAEERESRRRAILERVVLLGQQVTEVSDLHTTLEKIWHGVHDTLEFDRSGIFLYNPERNTMDGSIGTNIAGEMIDESNDSFPIAHGDIQSNDFKRVLESADGIYFTHDYHAEHNYAPEHQMYIVKDFVSVAAWAGNKPVAVICADHLVTGRPIRGEQVEALRLFAGYAALAIENARLNDALESELAQEKLAEELEARRRMAREKVIALGKTVTEVHDLRTTLKRIWYGIHDDLEFDRLAIFLYNPEKNSMDDTYGTDEHGQMVDFWDLSFPVTPEVTQALTFMRVLHKPDGVYRTNNYSVEHNIPEGDNMFGVKDFAAVAAWAGDKPVAVICVDNLLTGGVISDEQLEALRLFAGYAGLAIENARLNTALQKELTHRQALIDELENKNAELERFTYTVSHDLKSPLVTITGFLGFLEKDAIAGEPAKVRSTIIRINNAANKMQTLLNDLLELSRIGRLMNSPENIPFNEIVNEAVDRVRGKLDESNAMIEIQTDLPIVYGDRMRLIEVVQNLVENAAKYSSPRARPRIAIGARVEPQKSAIFFVRDNGIGIAPQYHENIFGLFNKLDAKADGTGIGLTLVKRIIEVHGGKIWVESESGKGATFYFTLPNKKEKE
jgi:PAS domain S-box-containing protein